MNIETIDIGESVLCDSCGGDFTNSEQEGGILFLSAAHCPKCEPDTIMSAMRYGEMHMIKARCPEGVSFRKWVLGLRNGNNTIKLITDWTQADRTRKVYRSLKGRGGPHDLGGCYISRWADGNTMRMRVGDKIGFAKNGTLKIIRMKKIKRVAFLLVSGSWTAIQVSVKEAEDIYNKFRMGNFSGEDRIEGDFVDPSNGAITQKVIKAGAVIGIEISDLGHTLKNTK